MYIFATSPHRDTFYATVMEEEVIAEIAQGAPHMIYFFAEVREI